jgi:gamma-glutamylcyclotransferase (GGCT)/AIG2-like uncharacterized protein YtfP
VVFKVHGLGWEALDKKEGVPHQYRRIPCVVLDSQGYEVEAATYQVVDARRQAFVPPHSHYVKIVREGLDAYGLESLSLEAASQNRPTPWMTDALFVYGTLMRGECRFPILRQFGLKCTLLAQVSGRLLDLESFPAMIDAASPESYVRGDFVRVEEIDSLIPRLDAVEGFAGFGHPLSFFRRVLVSVEVGEGRSRLAWTYCLAAGHDGAMEIDSGDWRAHTGIRESFLNRLVQLHADGDEHQLAAKLLKRSWFDDETPAQHGQALCPLATALASGMVSERLIAQASGRWVNVP